MIELNLVVELVKAQVYWEQGWGNDAQAFLDKAVVMAVDTEWEERIATITRERSTLEQIKAIFISNHPGLTTEQLDDYALYYHSADRTLDESQRHIAQEWDRILEETDKAWCNYVESGLRYTLEALIQSIGDKIHRRNLQISDLKREPERLKSRINRASAVVNQLLAEDMTDEQSFLSTKMINLRERIGKINLALLG